MKLIEERLFPTNGHILSFTRDTEKGWWIVEAAFPAKWDYLENDNIKCEVINENKVGKLVNIIPKKDGVIIDDQIRFVETVININKQIEQKEEEFRLKLLEMKTKMEAEANLLYTELDNMKDSSFKSTNTNDEDVDVNILASGGTVTTLEDSHVVTDADTITEHDET